MFGAACPPISPHNPIQGVLNNWIVEIDPGDHNSFIHSFIRSLVRSSTSLVLSTGAGYIWIIGKKFAVHFVNQLLFLGNFPFAGCAASCATRDHIT